MTGSEIAVIGMSLRLPGAGNIAEYWRNLCAGVESIQPLTDAELTARGEIPANLANPAYVRACSTLDSLDEFDAGFFGFSPQDAAIMDPQHRILLEVAWEALENSARTPESVQGSVAVFATCGMNAYMMHHLQHNRSIMDSVGEWLVRHTGNDMNFLATRLSYQFNLNGPSMNVQTACSSALVAIHLASQSLLSGECDMALAGGCVLNSLDRRGYIYKPGEILSPDGHCRPFDSRAGGTVFGNGAGMVVLRRLSDALSSGDRILAIVRGSAVNNDGARKVGYLAPGVDGQARVILEALAASGVGADTISLVEAHGTGTQVGDPIEVTALTRAYRRFTSKKGFCALGSVKSNIGHLGEAAGIAAFIKTVLALQHREIPPTLHFENPNPQIDLENSPFYVNATLRPWRHPDSPRRAGVTALGAGGTNCHVILEEAPAPRPVAPSRPYQFLTLSAQDPAALHAAAKALSAHLTGHPEVSLADAAFTLNLGRKAFPHRRFVVARDGGEAAAVLQASPSSRAAGAPPGVVFLFPGQGSQHHGMAGELSATFPAFAQTIQQCSAILKPDLGVDLGEILWGAIGDVNQTRFAQPALFVIEYALAKLWMSWGVKPRAMIGHSIGEYVAACLAGVFSLEDALHLVAARGLLMQRMPAGAMLAVPLSGEEALRSMNGRASAGTLSLAATNAPGLSVVAGAAGRIDEFARALAGKGIETRLLKTSHAFHSAMMDPILEPFRQKVQQTVLHAPELPFVSNLTGAFITAEQATGPDYWVRHLRNPVRFDEGLALLLREPEQVLLEVGPGRTLASLARQQERQPAAIVTSLPHPGQATPEPAHLLTACGELWSRAVPIDWEGFWARERRNRVELPSYSFQRRSYWIEPDPAPCLVTPDRAETPDRAPAAPAAPEASADVGSWLYQRSWKKSLPAPSKRHRKTWLLFADKTGLADGLAQRIAASSPPPLSLRLEQPRPGEIESLAWIDDTIPEPGQGQLSIAVRACGLNFADVLKATGDFPEAPFGMECAGIVTAVGPGVAAFRPGDEVIAIGPGSFRTHVVRDARLVAPKPAALTFEQAAALPAAYMTAWHALVDIAKVQPGERILIHAASGGVGLAAIEIARAAGAEIFATAGNEEKRAYLAAQGIRHVFNSRTLDFADQIAGGVDVVLNSLTGAFIPKSLGLLRTGGRFVEIGKKEILSSGQIPPQLAYFPVDLVCMLCDDPGAYGELLSKVVEQVRAGRLAPLPVRAFLRDDVHAAFDHMLHTRHIGKVVLSQEPAPAEIYTVREGAKFERTGQREFRIRPAAHEDYRRLMEALGDAAHRLDVIAHLWNVTGSESAAWERHLEHGFLSLTGLAKSLPTPDRAKPVELRVISSRLRDIAGETAIEAAKATLDGPCRVIPREFENLLCSSIDVELTPPQSVQRELLLEQLTAELTAEPVDRTVAYRGADRWVEYFEPAPRPAAQHHVLRRHGVYLITGGMGGIGMELAEHLAKTMQARLILVGRRFPDLARLRRVQAWEASGARVLIGRADVTDIQQMRRVLASAREAFGTVDGVFHAAGVLDDGPIALKEPHAARAVLAPKIQGALVLEELFRKTPVDFMVLFSSVASVLGLEGQADYAAANAFLDAFACRRAKQNRTRTIAIGWGAWKEVGMAAAAAGEAVNRVALSGDRDWMLAEHKLDGRHVLPGTGYLELIRSAFQAQPHGAAATIEISDVVFHAPLILEPGQTAELVISRRADSSFTIRSAETHVTGRIGYVDERAPQSLDLKSVRARCPRREDFPSGFPHQEFIRFGPRWSNLRRIDFGAEEALIELDLPPQFHADLDRFPLHPALLDFATGGAQALMPGFDPAHDFYVPFSYGRLRLHRSLPSHLFSHVRLRGPATFDITLSDPAGEVVAAITGFAMRPLRNRSWSSPAVPPEAPQGAHGISPEEGIEVLSRILDVPGGPHVLASARDLNAWLSEVDRSARPAPRLPHPSRNRSGSVGERLAEMWSSILGVEQVKPQDDFFELGGHSLLLLRLAARIEREFHKSIPLSALIQSPTIEKISALLHQEASLQTPFIVPFQDQRQGPAFFCVHSIGGEVMGYKALRRWMAPGVRLYGIQLPPEWRTSELIASVEAMAARYVDALLEFEPQGPYVLGGWSAGSPVALEMAHQLEARGHRVSLLVAIDGAPSNGAAGLSPWNPLYGARLVANLPLWLSETMSRKGVWRDLAYRAGQKIVGRCKSLAARWRGDTALSKYTVRGYLGSQYEEKDVLFMEAFSDALDRYHAAPYSGKVLLYEARTQPLHHLLQTGAAWKSLAKQLEIVPVPGSHVSMVEEPHVRALAEHLSRTVLSLSRTGSAS